MKLASMFFWDGLLVLQKTLLQGSLHFTNLGEMELDAKMYLVILRALFGTTTKESKDNYGLQDCKGEKSTWLFWSSDVLSLVYTSLDYPCRCKNCSVVTSWGRRTWQRFVCFHDFFMCLNMATISSLYVFLKDNNLYIQGLHDGTFQFHDEDFRKRKGIKEILHIWLPPGKQT